MARGELQCYGSSLYLKGEFGAGYHVATVFERTHGMTVEKSRAEAVLDVIRETVAGEC